MQEFATEVHNLLGIHLVAAQLSAFATYETELLAWNEKFNLTSIRSPQEIRRKHFLDSLSCLLAMGGREPDSLIDIGSGAGFPGIPLKIALPHLRLVLVESVNKKAGFCRHICQLLGFDQVEVITGRAEELGQQRAHREQYAWAVARAVASLPVLVEYLLPLVKIGGFMLAQKGASGPAEATLAARAIRTLGGSLEPPQKVNLPGIPEDRFLIVVKKIDPTPGGYPRRVGLPEKRPLL